MNNFERIKAMSIDEMAEWLVCCQKDFAKNVLQDFNLVSFYDYKPADNAVEMNKQWLLAESESEG